MIPIQRSYQRQQNFVSDASHELRTPLSIMQTSMEILEEAEQWLPDFHRKVLAGMTFNRS
jgi:signal transduction histidine kinase